MMQTVARPPRSWELGTVALLLAVAAAAGFSVFCALSFLTLRQTLQTDDVTVVSPVAGWVLDHLDDLKAVNLLLVIAYVGGFLIWRRSSQHLLRRSTSDPKIQLRHWSIVAWNLAIFASLFISLLNSRADLNDRDDAVSMLGIDVLHWAVRTGALAVLFIGIVQIRQRIRRSIAEPRIPAPATPRPAPAPVPAGAALAPATAPKSPARVLEPVPGAADLPPADEAFWERVRATTTDADLALLERTGLTAYRWKLVPANGDITALRATLHPGAVITVFPEPPSTQAPAKKFKPAPADEYHGFEESRETGAIWYQTIDKWRLPTFLTRAGTAGRWALYLKEEKTALSAVVPTE